MPSLLSSFVENLFITNSYKFNFYNTSFSLDGPYLSNNFCVICLLVVLCPAAPRGARSTQLENLLISHSKTTQYKISYYYISFIL